MSPAPHTDPRTPALPASHPLLEVTTLLISVTTCKFSLFSVFYTWTHTIGTLLCLDFSLSVSVRFAYVSAHITTVCSLFAVSCFIVCWHLQFLVSPPVDGHFGL